MVRRLSIRLGVLLLSILLPLLVAEGVVRWVVPGPERPPPGTTVMEPMFIGAEEVAIARRRIEDPLLVTEYRPGQRACAKDGRCVTISPLGIRRDPHDPLDLEDPAELRIAMVGDSFTFGYGVGDRQTLPAHLERQLRRAGRPGARVLNFGVSGYNAAQCYRVVSVKVPRFKPSMIIYDYFFNDTEHYIKEGNPTLTEATRVVPVAGGSLLKRVLLRSRLFEYLSTNLLHWQRERMVEQDKESDYLSFLHSSLWPGLWITRRSLEGMQRTAQGAGVPLVVVILADELPRELRQRLVSRVRGLCQELKIPVIDVTAPYLELPDRQRLWTTHGPGHYNDEGNRLVAGIVLKRLRRYLPRR